MKKTFILSILILSINGYAQSTSAQIDKICSNYDSLIQRSIDEEMDFYPAHIAINSTLNKRAIGEVDHTIKLYFDEIEEFEEPIDGEDYTMPYKYAMLRKAIVIFESGSYILESNYYFDEHGFLIKFHFSEMGYECYEEDTYFDEHNPIRITHQEIEDELCTDSDSTTEPYDKTKLNSQEIASAKVLIKQAEKYREMLSSHYEIIKN